MTKRNGNEIMVKAIENGTVLDHIPPKALANIISILHLDDLLVPWMTGNNFESHKMAGGTKAFIKIENYYFGKDTLDLISLFAPEATVNAIHNSIVSKHKIEIPAQVNKLIKCANPRCITNKEGEPFATSFRVMRADALSLMCKYCEKRTTEIRLR